MSNDEAMGFTHDNKENKTADWWTPKIIFDLLGLHFDLDASSPIGGVPWLPASFHYSILDDGLAKPWFGRVWLNPPYGKHTPTWLQKMHHHRDGIALVFARTDPEWFYESVAKADAVLFLPGRIPFVDGYGATGGGGAGSGSMLIAWGDDNVTSLKNFDTLAMQIEFKKRENYKPKHRGLFIDLRLTR